MARLRKLNFKIGGVLIETELTYSAKERRFATKIPSEYMIFTDTKKGKECCSLVQFGRSYSSRAWGFAADTEDEVIKKCEDYIEYYEAESTVIEKVILYDLDYSSKNVEWNKGSRHDGGASRISISYRIAEVYIIDKERKYFVDGREERVYGRKDPEIPYTPEAEKFFEDLVEAMETLMKKLGKYIGSEQVLLETIEGNVKLLE